MASMASSSSFCNLKFITKPNNNGRTNASSLPRIVFCQKHNDDTPTDQINRRELILRSSEIATIGAIFNFGGKKPDYLGVQKNPPALALCPATKNCVSTSENISDRTHYAPPWNYNPEVLLNGGHGGAMAELRNGFLKKRHRITVAWRIKDGGAMAAAIAMAAMADVAGRRKMAEFFFLSARDLGTSHDPCNQPRNQPRLTRCTQQPAATTHGVNGGDEHGVNNGDANGEDDPEPRPRLIRIESTTPDKFSPRIVERKEDYIRVEYQSSILGFVDDVEFWFPPGKGSTVEYRSASRLGNFDFDVNRKRIKALRQELEKKGWASQDTI
ncbi:hypothetical protein D0Y65_001529 [Glycine soja]|uniref:Uncharacterized protein n=1 Tax=Glycine soja TaxID=3848 RepID=A0A445M323_GLYSO|nr:hypothetical protein D0Y65_001529 [Glycine soja]